MRTIPGVIAAFMKETVKKIRELLDELESKIPPQDPSFRESFQLFELPELVARHCRLSATGSSAIRGRDILAHISTQHHRYGRCFRAS